jgi:hypothetical protein
METIIQVLGLASLSVMFAWWFEPLQWVKTSLQLYKYNWLVYLYCSKCISFWVSLLWFQNLFLAAFTAVITFCLDNLITFIDEQRKR